jgi:hypothetical protein
MQRLAVGLFAVAGAVAAVVGAASAAELPLPPIWTKAPPMIESPLLPPPTTGNFDISGILAGGQIGFNWQ